MQDTGLDCGGHRSPFERYIDLVCEAGAERCDEKAVSSKVRGDVVKDLTNTAWMESQLSYYLDFHFCEFCQDDECECGKPLACEGCVNCEKFFITAKSRERLHPSVAQEYEGLSIIAEDANEAQIANWCCGADHYPFHYRDCGKYPGHGLAIVRNEYGEDEIPYM